MTDDFTFEGWRRPDGRLGIRNHCLVLATVVCAAGVVREVARRLPEVVGVEHPHGCGRGFLSRGAHALCAQMWRTERERESYQLNPTHPDALLLRTPAVS